MVKGINMNLPQYNYDKDADVMYITFGDPKACSTTETNGLLVRTHEGKLNGITILDYSKQIWN